MKNLITACAATLIVLLSGCASVTGTKNEPVSVDSFYQNKEIVGCNCKLVNDKGVWFVTTPGSVVIQKSYENLLITCTKDGMDTGSAIFESKAAGGAWGNILAGGPIGYAIDRSSGAGFDYPPSMNVEMGVLNKAADTSKQAAAASGNKSQQPPATNTASTSPNKEGMGSQAAKPTNVASTTDSAATTLPTRTASQELRELQDLRKNGLITESDYQKKKQEILNKL